MDSSPVKQLMEQDVMVDMTREELTGLLKENVLAITFTKKDGSVRSMTATLMESVLPAKDSEDTRTKKPNPNVVSVWSVHDQGFRSFRLDSVVSIGIQESEENQGEKK